MLDILFKRSANGNIWVVLNFPSHYSNLLAGTFWHGVLILHFAFMHQNLMLNNTTAKWEFYRKKA